ncbi:MAG TPA: hypothetical protein DCE42_20500 [Myxococcales bacterium]|nr:hypothetical protein [Deltaproteobacteria bacterium]MBU54221.1 hypothetical protein [Deltaproteobacteria bacterium]HAA57158.1 hypothetical protein [Myxococcales bacterium]
MSQQEWTYLADQLRRTYTPKGRASIQSFSIEGYKLVERALDANAPLTHLLLSERLKNTPPPRFEALKARLATTDCECIYAPHEVLETFIEKRTFGPLVGLVSSLPQASFETFSDTSKDCKWIILQSLKDPGNIGALMRTSLASGVQAMFCLGGTEPFHPKAARTSMGAIFDLPIRYMKDEEALFDALKKYNVQSIGAIVDDGVAPYESCPAPRHALFVGNEAHGLPKEMQARIELKWSIPMYSTVDSFSVNAATSILLYELNRQSWDREEKVG